MFDLEKALALPNALQEFLDDYRRDQDRSVCLYGAGAGYIWNLLLLEKYHVPIAAIIDKRFADETKVQASGKTYLGMPLSMCHRFQKAPLFVISAPAHEREIRECLSEAFPDSMVYCFDATLDVLQGRNTPDQFKEYIKENAVAFQNIYNTLADADSKKVLWNVLCGGITYRLDYYREVASRNVYFPDVIRARMGKQEVFVDAGAFTGDTVEEFMELVGEGNYRHIYAFEPDENNFKALVGMSEKKDRLTVLKKGCFDRADTLFFRGDGDGTDAGARIVGQEDATQKIEVVKLDDVIQDDVTFLKMDIEGSELAALRGAQDIIKRCKPKLAISVYHKMEDIIEIVSFIQGLGLGYELYLYHYWECTGSDTVVVAV